MKVVVTIYPYPDTYPGTKLDSGVQTLRHDSKVYEIRE